MPVINMEKLPLLGIVFSLVNGYFTLDSSSDDFKPSYQARALFREINIGQCGISLAAVTASDWYNSNAKHTSYGGRMGIQLKQGSFNPSAIVESGYRTFFDVAADDPSHYQDGPYGRLWLGVSFDGSSRKDWRWNYHLVVESSPQNWPLPKIGFMVTLEEPKLMTYFEYFDDDRAKGFNWAGNLRDVGINSRKQ